MQTIREPAPKQCARQPDQIAKDRNNLTDQPRRGPEDKRDADPDSTGLEGVLVHDVVGRVAQEANVHPFDRDVAIDDAGDDDGWESEAEGDLAEEGRCGEEGW